VSCKNIKLAGLIYTSVYYISIGRGLTKFYSSIPRRNVCCNILKSRTCLPKHRPLVGKLSTHSSEF